VWKTGVSVERGAADELMDFGLEETSGRGLRRYVDLVTRALGITGECSYVEVRRPFAAYLALDGRLARFPDQDVALLWDEEHGWAMAVESHSAEDPLVIARRGGEPVPHPDAVAAWAIDLLQDQHDSGPVHALPTPSRVEDIVGELMTYAAAALSTGFRATA